jgi:hypothetical protein
MKRFDSLDQIPVADLPTNQALVVEEVLENLIAAYTRSGQQYDPEEHGYVVLVERGDENALKELLGYEPARAPYERTHLLYGCFITAVVYDQFGIGLVVPDEDWLDPGMRLALESSIEIEKATSH